MTLLEKKKKKKKKKEKKKKKPSVHSPSYYKGTFIESAHRKYSFRASASQLVGIGSVR